VLVNEPGKQREVRKKEFRPYWSDLQKLKLWLYASKVERVAIRFRIKDPHPPRLGIEGSPCEFRTIQWVIRLVAARNPFLQCLGHQCHR
jgi:hypothetical protein